MANNRDNGVGLGIRLTRSEVRRLDELTRMTGRKPAGVLRGLLGMASPGDAELVARLKSCFYVKLIGGSDHAEP